MFTFGIITYIDFLADSAPIFYKKPVSSALFPKYLSILHLFFTIP